MSGTDGDAPIVLATQAIMHLLRRAGTDVDFADVMLATRSLRVLSEAYDALRGRPAGETLLEVEEAGNQLFDRGSEPQRVRSMRERDALEREVNWYRQRYGQAGRDEYAAEVEAES